jgi:hypothetical protein
MASTTGDGDRNGRRGRGLLALGVSLARGGVMSKVGLGIAGLTVFLAITVPIALSRDEAQPPLAVVPAVGASALAWGAGVILAFAGAAHALRRDHDEGIRALLAARGANADRYVWGRVGGLALLLAIVVGGGTLVIGAVSIFSARAGGLALDTAQGTLASIVYAIAFALVLAPLSMAALGARSRMGGYAWLLALLFLPELFEDVTRTLVPRAWNDVVSIPAALASLRGALMPAHLDPMRLARSLIVLSFVAVFCMLIVLQQTDRVDAEKPS